MKKITILALVLYLAGVKAQNVPKIGTDSTLEIANWNTQWYGSGSGGPSNEPLQQQNVWEVISKSNMDVWGLCEVSDTNAWDTLLAKLPIYDGVISTWSQTQKTALMFKKSMFRWLYTKHPLSGYSYDFAGGRLPLEVGLEANMGTWKDTIVFLVTHLKANVGTDLQKEDAWNRRNQATMALKAYIESLGKNRKCMVLGDWNDDLDKSIYSTWATPYQFWLNDSLNFKFPTLKLTKDGDKSMDAFTEVIDHQCVYGRMLADVVPSSAKVFYLTNYVTNYASTTSDHFPVYSVFKLKQSNWLGTNPVDKPEIKVYYDGVKWVVNGLNNPVELKWFELAGRQVTEPVSGVYLARIRDGNQHYSLQIYVCMK
jgi:Endonuclease/Exonuclease/phosphatase family